MRNSSKWPQATLNVLCSLQQIVSNSMIFLLQVHRDGSFLLSGSSTHGQFFYSAVQQLVPEKKEGSSVSLIEDSREARNFVLFFGILF